MSVACVRFAVKQVVDFGLVVVVCKALVLGQKSAVVCKVACFCRNRDHSRRLGGDSGFLGRCRDPVGAGGSGVALIAFVALSSLRAGSAYQACEPLGFRSDKTDCCYRSAE